MKKSEKKVITNNISLEGFLDHFCVIVNKDFRKPTSDQGCISITKDHHLKSNENLRKFSVIIVGDTLGQLKENFDKIHSEYYYCFQQMLSDLKKEGKIKKNVRKIKKK